MFSRKSLFVPLLCIAGNTSNAQQPNFKDSVNFYYARGEYEKALHFSEQQVQQTRYADSNSTDYAAALIDLGTLKQAFGDAATADSLYRVGAAIQLLKLGEQSVEYAVTLSNLGYLQNQSGNYPEAERNCKKAIAIFEALHILNDTFAVAFNNLGLVYQNVGRFNAARQQFEQALQLSNSIGGKGSDSYFAILNNLGLVAFKTGDYNAAENHFNEALEIKKADSLQNLPMIALLESNLATFYNTIGNRRAAEPLVLDALKIRAATLGTDNPDYAISLNNRANILMEEKAYQRADSAYRLVEAVMRKSLPEAHPFYLKILTNRALSLARLGYATKSDSLLQEVIRICRKAGMENSVDYAEAVGQLGREYYYRKNYSEATTYLQNSVGILKSQLGTSHPYYTENEVALCELFLATDRYAAAASVAEEVAIAEKAALLDKLAFLSEPELLFYLQKQQAAFALPYCLLRKQPAGPAGTAYNEALFLKGIGIQNTNSLAPVFEQSKDSSLSLLWVKYRVNRKKLTGMLTQTEGADRQATDSITAIANRQEKELLRKSADYRNMQQQLNITWKDVRSQLRIGQVAIEFVAYRQQKQSGTGPDTTAYSALLLRQLDTMPVYIHLCNEPQLLEAMHSFAYKSGNAPAAMVAGPADAIYRLLWEPLLPYLTGIDTIYFSPDGLLQQVALAAIKSGRQKLLCDDYTLIQLTSTRQLVVADSTTTLPATITLFGGIRYDAADVVAFAKKKPVSPTSWQSRSSMLSGYPYLPETLTEIAGIQQSIVDRKKSTTVFTGSQATKEAFRKGSGPNAPGILHFATHGFAYPATSGGNVFTASANPLVRCGLVMAGGNRGWMGHSQVNEDNGILTGLEIAGMQLRGTRLVVMSACETAYGAIQNSEGVFSLQRAFKLAGARYIIASLWTVPNKETTDFMETFYHNLALHPNITTAFLQTQQAMRKKYAPYYWAAFTLVQ